MGNCGEVELPYHPSDLRKLSKVDVARGIGPSRGWLHGLDLGQRRHHYEHRLCARPWARGVREAEPVLAPIFGLTSWLRTQADAHGTA